jgi:hypothetical protein
MRWRRRYEGKSRALINRANVRPRRRVKTRSKPFRHTIIAARSHGRKRRRGLRSPAADISWATQEPSHALVGRPTTRVSLRSSQYGYELASWRYSLPHPRVALCPTPPDVSRVTSLRVDFANGSERGASNAVSTLRTIIASTNRSRLFVVVALALHPWLRCPRSALEPHPGHERQESLRTVSTDCTSSAASDDPCGALIVGQHQVRCVTCTVTYARG